MNRDMNDWLNALRKAPVKQAMPLLSFPAVQLLGVSVRELIASSDLQAEAMERVAHRTKSAACVSFMDLSVEAECFGASVHVTEEEVPTVVGRLISSYEEAEALTVPQVGAGRTGISIDAIRRVTRRVTDRPVFAGVIGPFSLTARLLDVAEAMVSCYEDQEMVHLLLEKATQYLIAYCEAFREAGADGVVLAEPVAGMLSPGLSAEFSAPYVRRIVEAVQDDQFVVIYHNCGDFTIQMIDSILSTGAAAYHFGNAIDMKKMMAHIPEDAIAMGNVDPAGQFLHGTPASIGAATRQVLADCGGYPNFLISSGCDIPPLAGWENIDAFFSAVDEFYAARQVEV